MLKNRYYFCDLTVMMRVAEGKFLDLTGLSVYSEREYRFLNCTADFCFYFDSLYTENAYVVPVTLAELVQLSRMKTITDLMSKKMKGGTEITPLIAQIATKKILESAYGIAEPREDSDGEIWIDFKRLLRPMKSDGKRRKVYSTIFSMKAELIA